VGLTADRDHSTWSRAWLLDDMCPLPFLNSWARVYDREGSSYRLEAQVKIKCHGMKENPSNSFSFRGEFYSYL